jgi:hypothetical protein
MFGAFNLAPSARLSAVAAEGKKPAAIRARFGESDVAGSSMQPKSGQPVNPDHS